MFYFVGEVVFEQLVQVGLDFLPCAGLDALQIQLLPSFAVDHTTLHKFKTEFVILQPQSLAIGPLLMRNQFLLDVVLFNGFSQEVFIEFVDALSQRDFDIFE